MEVRDETLADRRAVRDVHLAAFGDDGVLVAALVDDLREAVARGAGLSLVADARGGRVIGHVMFSGSFLLAPRGPVPVQVLSPIGVLPAWQSRGVGTALIRRGIDVLADRDVPLVFLEGPPAYYARSGFESATRLGFGKPSPRVPDEAFQVLLLPAYEPWMRGTLVYAEPFWRHDAVGPRRGQLTHDDP